MSFSDIKEAKLVFGINLKTCSLLANISSIPIILSLVIKAKFAS